MRDGSVSVSAGSHHSNSGWQSNEIEAVVANVVISRERRTALLARSLSCFAGLRVWRYGDGSCLAMRLRKVAYVLTRMCNGQCMASK